MKKITSVVVLILCSILSTSAIYFASFPVTFEQIVLGDNTIVAIALEGIISYLIIKYAMLALVKFPVNKSQKIELSENGMRYKVWGVITVAYYVANMIREIMQHSNHLVVYLFAGSLCAVYGVLLFMQGGKVASEYTAKTSIDPKDKAALQVESEESREATMHKEISSSLSYLDTSIPKDALMKLKELYDEGVLTEEEFSKKKKDLLGL